MVLGSKINICHSAFFVKILLHNAREREEKKMILTRILKPSSTFTQPIPNNWESVVTFMSENYKNGITDIFISERETYYPDIMARKKWKEGEEFTREDAMIALEGIKQILDKVYYRPIKTIFRDEEEYATALVVVAELKKYISERGEGG